MPDCQWRASHRGRIIEALYVALDAPTLCLAPGAESAIARGLAYYRAAGDRPAVVRLEAIAVQMAVHRGLLREQDLAEAARVRRKLAELARSWLLDAPLFPESEQEGPAVHAA